MRAISFTCREGRRDSVVSSLTCCGFGSLLWGFFKLLIYYFIFKGRHHRKLAYISSYAVSTVRTMFLEGFGVGFFVVVLNLESVFIGLQGVFKPDRRKKLRKKTAVLGGSTEPRHILTNTVDSYYCNIGQ